MAVIPYGALRTRADADRPVLKLADHDPASSVVRTVVDAAVRARMEIHREQQPVSVFGARLLPRLEAARDLGDGHVEVYERIWDPDLGQRRHVTRMKWAGDAQWVVASEAPCHEDEVSALVVSADDGILSALEPCTLPCGSRIEPSDGGASLAATTVSSSSVHARAGGRRNGRSAEFSNTEHSSTSHWFARIRPEPDVEVPHDWIHTVGSRPNALRVSLSLSRDLRTRNTQLAWLSQALPHLGHPRSRIIGVPGVARWMPAGEWRELAAHATRWRTLLGLWCRVERRYDGWTTRGMSRWMLPELRVEGSQPSATSMLRTWMLRLTAHHDRRLELGVGAEAPALWDPGFRLYDHEQGDPCRQELQELETSFRLGASSHEPWRTQLAEPVCEALRSRWGTVRITE